MQTKNSFTPYPFQSRAFDLVLRQGKSVIVQAPTGFGKTRMALMPYLQNLATGGALLPLTCRYAVPQRVLANQFYREYQEIVSKIDRRAPTRLQATYQQFGCSPVSIQTGEQPDDPQFASALTFCTIDQLLASFMAIPYSMGPGRANINVAAIAGSYLILDEYHLYPLLRNAKAVLGARTTSLTMLELLKSTTPFVLMTATYSSVLLTQLCSLLDAELVTVGLEEQLAIAQGRTRTFWRASEPMHAAALLAEHRSRSGPACTLIICNTVTRAQALFLQLREAQAQGTRVILLHSRFSKEDRRLLSEEIERELGPQQWSADGGYLGRDILVIATQVVEVGLNISSQVLHTENAPASSLIQRAGRNARFAGQQGTVIVYPLAQPEGQTVSTLPYDRQLCEKTWDALAAFHGKELGFPQEQELIDLVHSEEDRDLLQRYAFYKEEIRKQIFTSFNTNNRSVSSQLIRDVTQVQILIHDHPGEAIQEKPWNWQSFSIHPDSLRSEKRWNALQERGADLEWVCKEAKPLLEAQPSSDGEEGLENKERTPYRWDTVTNRAGVANALMLALPSQLAYYDSALGFALLDGSLPLQPNGYQSTPLTPSNAKQNQLGSRETSYQAHISGLLHAYKHLSKEIAYISQRLEHALALPAGTLDHAIRLAIACHDLGKLNRSWQQWAFSWQTLLFERQRHESYQLREPSFCFAKTDYNYSPEQRRWQAEVRPKRPRHACESVAISRRMIAASLGISRSTPALFPVLRAVCAAIARHHSAQASHYGPVQLDERALLSAESALQTALQHTSLSYDSSLLMRAISAEGDLAPVSAAEPQLTIPAFDAESDLETWLYFVIVRTLRLADQRAG